MYLLEEFVENLYNFSLKYLVAFTSVLTGAWYFLFWMIITYWFNLLKRYSSIWIVCFLGEFCVFQRIVFFKELICFIYVITFGGIKLFIILFYYPFNACGIYSKVPSFISHIHNLSFFFFCLVNLTKGLLILWIFSKSQIFGLLIFL